MGKELIAQLESADGPDRKLLEAAYLMINPEPVGEQAPVQTANWRNWSCGCYNFRSLLSNEAYLDAAFKLVPEGWSIGLGDLRGYNPVIWRAHLRDHRPDSLTPAGHAHIWWEGHAATPALALAAAALKARGLSRIEVAFDTEQTK